MQYGKIHWYYAIDIDILQILSLVTNMGGAQNLERRNVERPVFRNFEIANIKIKKDDLFDNFIFEIFFLHFLEIFWTLEMFNNF